MSKDRLLIKSLVVATGLTFVMGIIRPYIMECFQTLDDKELVFRSKSEYDLIQAVEHSLLKFDQSATLHDAEPDYRTNNVWTIPLENVRYDFVKDLVVRSIRKYNDALKDQEYFIVYDFDIDLQSHPAVLTVSLWKIKKT